MGVGLFPTPDWLWDGYEQYEATYGEGDDSNCRGPSSDRIRECLVLVNVQFESKKAYRVSVLCEDGWHQTWWPKSQVSFDKVPSQGRGMWVPEWLLEDTVWTP